MKVGRKVELRDDTKFTIEGDTLVIQNTNDPTYLVIKTHHGIKELLKNVDYLAQSYEASHLDNIARLTKRESLQGIV